MTEQTFRSPGFFEREVDLTQRTVEIEGIPAGIIGTSTHGPAFVPVTLGSYSDFERKFGSLSKDKFGPYAVKEWLKNRSSVTYIRVLGAGAANSTDDVLETETSGIVKNAGFVIKGTPADAQPTSPVPSEKRHAGSVQFLTAVHSVTANEQVGYPIFSDNQSYDTTGNIRLVRAMIYTSVDTRIQLLNHDEEYSSSNVSDDIANISDYTGTNLDGTFKLVISSSQGSSYSNDEGNAGIKIYTASLNPENDHYIGNFLNNSPENFQSTGHLLYADFPVEDQLARVTYDGSSGTVGILSGSDSVSSVSSLEFRDLFGRFDTRYTTAKTTPFISQPFGSKEYDLFHFEALDDGEVGNKRVKVSISNLRKSTNPKVKFGTFNVLIRDVNDSDTNLKVLEQFSNCTLDPRSEDYIANKVGDMKVYFNFNAATESERRLNVAGKRPNQSRYVRIVMNDAVENRKVPEDALPFGFRGIPVLKMNNNLTDNDTVLEGGTLDSRLASVGTGLSNYHLTGSILPPLPFRFKSTRGAVKSSSPDFIGEAGSLEIADKRYFWGVKSEVVGSNALQPNASAKKNNLVEGYSKFLGIGKLDALVSDQEADELNNNKFTLARVALSGSIPTSSNIESEIASVITESSDEHVRDAVYIRNGNLETKNYTIKDSISNDQRVTFATLAAARSAKYFNKFSQYAKFTNIMHGGFDGINILDPDAQLMNDKASSVSAGGLAAGDANGYKGLDSSSSPGTGKDNSTVSSYRTAAKIITDPFASRVNIVALPGIKEPFVTDYVSDLTREYSKAIYLMDIPAFDDASNRVFDSSVLPSVTETIDQFDGRAIDNNYVATYFPDMIFKDEENNINVELPASIASLKALGYNDSIAYPWFAPAGFNRGALNNAVNSSLRLNAEDRNNLYEARINPIANFPNGGFVIFGQKTLQQDRSSLDRVNVRRMLLEVKRIVSDVANNLIFEQNTPQTRARFVAEVTPALSTIQVQQGVDQFQVVMDSSNNSNEDIQTNRLNGKIVLVPTRAIEFIAVDFIITNSGVSFN